MTEDEVKKANMNATNDITLYCWIGMDVNHDTHKLAPYFYEFVGEVAVDDRQIAWNTVNFYDLYLIRYLKRYLNNANFTLKVIYLLESIVLKLVFYGFLFLLNLFTSRIGTTRTNLRQDLLGI